MFGGHRVKPRSACENSTEASDMELTFATAWASAKSIAPRLWRIIKERTGKIQELERRVSALERALETAPGQACPKCGTREFRAEKSVPHPIFDATRMVTYKCQACSYKDVYVRPPGKGIEF